MDKRKELGPAPEEEDVGSPKLKLSEFDCIECFYNFAFFALICHNVLVQDSSGFFQFLKQFEGYCFSCGKTFFKMFLLSRKDWCFSKEIQIPHASPAEAE